MEFAVEVQESQAVDETIAGAAYERIIATRQRTAHRQCGRDQGALYDRLNAWGRHRDVPDPPRETFHQWYVRTRGRAEGDQS